MVCVALSFSLPQLQKITVPEQITCLCKHLFVSLALVSKDKDCRRYPQQIKTICSALFFKGIKLYSNWTD